VFRGGKTAERRRGAAARQAPQQCHPALTGKRRSSARETTQAVRPRQRAARQVQQRAYNPATARTVIGGVPRR